MAKGSGLKKAICVKKWMAKGLSKTAARIKCKVSGAKKARRAKGSRNFRCAGRAVVKALKCSPKRRRSRR